MIDGSAELLAQKCVQELKYFPERLSACGQKKLQVFDFYM